MKTFIMAADLLNDKVLPSFQSQEVSMQRMLTYRGTQFCEKVEQHDYQLYLAMKDIDQQMFRPAYFQEITWLNNWKFESVREKIKNE